MWFSYSTAHQRRRTGVQQAAESAWAFGGTVIKEIKQLIECKLCHKMFLGNIVIWIV